MRSGIPIPRLIGKGFPGVRVREGILAPAIPNGALVTVDGSTGDVLGV